MTGRIRVKGGQRRFSYLPQEGGVYFARAVGIEAIKIGRTGCLADRMDTLQTSLPFELELLGWIRDGKEHEIHRRFKDHRIKGEWFYEVPELLEYIDQNAIKPEAVVDEFRLIPRICNETRRSVIDRKPVQSQSVKVRRVSLNFRLDLLQEIEAEASANDLSLNSYLVLLLTKRGETTPVPRVEPSALREGLVRYLDLKRALRVGRVTVAEIMSNHLKLDPVEENRLVQHRVADALRLLGWERRRVWNEDTGRKEFFFFAPPGYFDK